MSEDKKLRCALVYRLSEGGASPVMLAKYMNPMAVRVVLMKRHCMVDAISPMCKPCRLLLPMIHPVACRKVARLVASR
jgi:hypothetical protein